MGRRQRFDALEGAAGGRQRLRCGCCARSGARTPAAEHDGKRDRHDSNQADRGQPQRDLPTPAIIVKEVLPNLMPFIVASLVGSVSAAVLASVGLEVLGLGSFDSLTLGMTLYWVIYYAAIINSWWWWWIPPIVIIIVLFTGLFMIAVGLDEISNPRLRRRI